MSTVTGGVGPAAAGAGPHVAGLVRRVAGAPVVRLLALRTAAAAVIVVALAASVFVLQKISPLDPVKAMLGPGASAAKVAEQRAAMGLDDPFLAQFGRFLGGLVQGDLGTSYRTRRPVMTDLSAFVPATAELALTAIVLALLLGAFFAVSTSLRWPGASLLRGVLLAGASAPASCSGSARSCSSTSSSAGSRPTAGRA